MDFIQEGNWIMSDLREAIEKSIQPLVNREIGWIHDQLDGTSFSKDALDEVESSRTAALDAILDAVIAFVNIEDEDYWSVSELVAELEAAKGKD